MSVSHQVLTTMLDAVAEGVYHTDVDRRILHWNSASHGLTGFEPGAVVGLRCQDRVLRHVDHQGLELCDTARCPLVVPLGSTGRHHAEMYLHHREGHLVPVSVRSFAHRDETGAVTGVTQLFAPRSPTKGPQDWKRAALTDALTGLGNRRAFRQAWARAHRGLTTKGTAFGLLMVDVDHFKRVNDNHGHGVGDKVLKMVAKTIAGCVRQNDAAVRWGGEEFLVLVRQADALSLGALAERMRQLVAQGWVAVGTEHLGVTVSVGGALARVDDRADDVVGRADARLFSAKQAGRNRTVTGD
jgi:diguanylate cyclase (GGDEF)-like protein